jgi:hypothetical protein
VPVETLKTCNNDIRYPQLTPFSHPQMFLDLTSDYRHGSRPSVAFNLVCPSAKAGSSRLHRWPLRGLTCFTGHHPSHEVHRVSQDNQTRSPRLTPYPTRPTVVRVMPIVVHFRRSRGPWRIPSVMQMWTSLPACEEPSGSNAKLSTSTQPWCRLFALRQAGYVVRLSLVAFY